MRFFLMQCEGHNIQVDVCVGSRFATFWVAKRPFVEEFVSELYPLYEIVLYTAGRQEYADAIIGKTI